jgi:hypothetical protein
MFKLDNTFLTLSDMPYIICCLPLSILYSTNLLFNMVMNWFCCMHTLNIYVVNRSTLFSMNTSQLILYIPLYLMFSIVFTSIFTIIYFFIVIKYIIKYGITHIPITYNTMKNDVLVITKHEILFGCSNVIANSFNLCIFDFITEMLDNVMGIEGNNSYCNDSENDDDFEIVKDVERLQSVELIFKY